MAEAAGVFRPAGARAAGLSARAEAERPLAGDLDANGVINPGVIWACTNCGACVNECPVDIEHIDHINGMRRHQVLVESAKKATGQAKQSLEVIDVAQLLVRAVKLRESATPGTSDGSAE